MSLATGTVKLLKYSANFCVSAVGFLFESNDDEDNDRSRTNDSDLFGKYNFRTQKMDSGADPYGIYEEDL